VSLIQICGDPCFGIWPRYLKYHFTFWLKVWS